MTARSLVGAQTARAWHGGPAAQQDATTQALRSSTPGIVYRPPSSTVPSGQPLIMRPGQTPQPWPTHLGKVVSPSSSSPPGSSYPTTPSLRSSVGRPMMAPPIDASGSKFPNTAPACSSTKVAGMLSSQDGAGPPVSARHVRPHPGSVEVLPGGQGVMLSGVVPALKQFPPSTWQGPDPHSNATGRGLASERSQSQSVDSSDAWRQLVPIEGAESVSRLQNELSESMLSSNSGSILPFVRGGITGASCPARASSSQEGMSSLDAKFGVFTAKIEEMRMATSALHNVMREQREQGDQEVGEAPSLEHEVRVLQRELKAESQAREKAMVRLANVVESEVRWREEAVAREAAHKGQVEAMVMEMRREARTETAVTSRQTQELACDFTRVREEWRKEMISHRLEISDIHEELVRLCEQLKHGVSAPQVLQDPSCSDPSGVGCLRSGDTDHLSLLLNKRLVHEEVRRQLAEHSDLQEALLRGRAAKEQLLRLDEALHREISAREGADSKLLATLQDSVREERRCLQQDQQDLERRIQLQLEAMMEEVRVVLHDEVTRSARTWEKAIANEVKEREGLCHVILKHVDENMQEVRRCGDMSQRSQQELSTHDRPWQEELREVRRHCEEALNAHEEVLQRQVATTLEATVGSMVERSTTEVFAAKQEILELREELSEGLRSEAEARGREVARLKAATSTADAKAEAEEKGEGAGRIAHLVALEDLHSALLLEAKAREKSFSEVHHLLDQERQGREEGDRLLERRIVQSEEQTVFVESGKREEIRAELAKVSEDLEAVRKQLPWQPHSSPHSSLSASSALHQPRSGLLSSRTAASSATAQQPRSGLLSSREGVFASLPPPVACCCAFAGLEWLVRSCEGMVVRRLLSKLMQIYI